MLSLSMSARMLAPRLVAAGLAPAAVAVAAPRVLLHSRGLATSTAEYPSPAASAARPASAAPTPSASKTGKKADAPKKSAAPKKAATSGRGARRTNKTQPTAAASARAATRLVKQAQRNSQMQQRQAKITAAREARRLRAQLRREKKQTLLQAKAARRQVAIAKRRERHAKNRELQAERRARELQTRSRRRAELEESIKAKLQRAISFADKHPVVARRRAEEAAGLPVAPRRPPSTYNSFIKSRVAEIKAKKPDMAPTEMLKQAAADFKALPADEKARLDEEYQKRAAKFETQKQKYEASLPPKKPLTPYIAYFVRVNGDVMRSNPGLDIKEVASKIGEQWRALSEADKKPLVSTFNKEMAEWKDKLAAWVEAHPGAQLVRFTKPSMTSVRKEVKAAQANKTKTH